MNMLFVVVNSQGLYLSVSLPCGLLFERLFIPWSKIAGIEEIRGFFSSAYTITVEDHVGRITLYGAAGRSAKMAYVSAASIGAL